MKGQNGITLVALIITIIVLLILAVVTIRTITETPIINYAQNAQADYSSADEAEQTTIKAAENLLDNIVGTKQATGDE